MNLFSRIGAFLEKFLYNPKWRCISCGKEIFDDNSYFCEACKEKLPTREGAICAHCGRETVAPVEYCDTCKGRLTAIDKGRSAFEYDKPISGLIKRAKYGGEKYILTALAEYLSLVYFKNYFAADVIVYVPMTKKAERKRGYNHGKVLAEKTSEIVGVPVLDCLEKTRETKRQAKLNAESRKKNLIGAFKVTDKRAAENKTVLIIDDVTTTGATGEAVAEALKKAGASSVLLLTVAAVSFLKNKRTVKK